MIIDSDADVDEAVPAIFYSAFGYQGQKCSALSRLIVLKDNYDRVLERLIEASKGLKVGLPEEPGTVVGPVIDKAAYERILGYIEIGKTGGQAGVSGTRCRRARDILFRRRFSRTFHRGRASRRRRFSGRCCACSRRRTWTQALALGERHGIRADGRVFFAQPGEHRARVKREMEVGQFVHQPRHHGGDGGAASVRRVQDVRRRDEGGRAGLSAEFSTAARGDGKRHAAGFRAGGNGEWEKGGRVAG